MRGPYSAAVPEFFEEIMQTRWPEQVWKVVLRTAQKFGFSAISYVHLPPLGAADQDQVLVAAHGYPDDWVTAYIRDKRYRDDPFLARAVATTDPFFWKDAESRLKLRPPEKAFLEELTHLDLGSGMSFQNFGPQNRLGYSTVVIGKGADKPSSIEINALQWMFQTAHNRYCKMLYNSQGQLPDLSEREREILAWVARGKSNSVIADIVGLSTHTVDAYVRRIFSKLGTRDRITATLRGLGRGAITGIG